jgi:hypothetical protein
VTSPNGFQFTQQDMRNTQNALDACVQSTNTNMNRLESECMQGINSGMAGLSVAALQDLLNNTIKPTGVDIAKCFERMRTSLAEAQNKMNTGYDQAAGDALKKLRGDVGTLGPLSQKLGA